jgi:hypothetical protein
MSNELKGENMKVETLGEFAKLLGLENIAEDKLFESVNSKIKTLSKLGADLQKKADEQTKEIAQLKKRSSGDGDRKLSIDPNIVEQIATTGAKELDLLVKSGRITKDVRDQLYAALVGVEGSRNWSTLCLSKDNGPSIFGEQSKLQVLSRETPGGDDDEGKPNEAGAKAMSRGAGLVEETNK